MEDSVTTVNLQNIRKTRLDIKRQIKKLQNSLNQISYSIHKLQAPNLSIMDKIKNSIHIEVAKIDKSKILRLIEFYQFMGGLVEDLYENLLEGESVHIIRNNIENIDYFDILRFDNLKGEYYTYKRIQLDMNVDLSTILRQARESSAERTKAAKEESKRRTEQAKIPAAPLLGEAKRFFEAQKESMIDLIKRRRNMRELLDKARKKKSKVLQETLMRRDLLNKIDEPKEEPDFIPFEFFPDELDYNLDNLSQVFKLYIENRDVLHYNYLLNSLRDFYKYLPLNKKVFMKLTQHDGSYKYYPIELNRIETLKLMIQDLEEEDREDILLSTPGSDVYALDYHINPVMDVRVLVYDTVPNSSGSFFPYINLSDYDLTRYQIYHRIPETVEHCLSHSLRIQGADVTKIVHIFQRGFRRTNLSEVAEILNAQIELYYCYITDTNCKIKKIIYGSSDVIYRLALYENHYFVNDIITDGKYNNTILHLVRDLHLMGYFQESQDVIRHVKYETQSESLRYIEDEQLEFVCKEKFVDHDRQVIFADTEADITQKDGNLIKHQLLMSGYVHINDDQVNIITSGTYKDTLDHIIRKYGETKAYARKAAENNDLRKKHPNKNIEYMKRKNTFRVYFHNLKYDISLISKDLQRVNNLLIKGTSYYSIKAIYNNHKFEFVDFYKILAKPLSKIPEELGFEESKQEYIAYGIYNAKNKHLSCIPLETYLEGLQAQTPKTPIDKDVILNDEVVKQFVFDRKGVKYYRHMDHYKYYLKYDCLVLKRAAIEMRDALRDITNLDMFDYLTISSMADRYMQESGAYEGVYELGGCLRNFTQQANVGGRCCMRNNIKQVVRGFIQDFDGVSLYPSAMSMIGLPMGPAKLIRDKDHFNNLFYNRAEDVTYMTMRIKVISTSIKQQIPMIATKARDGSRHWTNKCDGHILVVDDITLQDYIKFQGMEFEFMEGVFWNEGLNHIMAERIKYLFNERLKYKNLMDFELTEGSPEYKRANTMQMTIKLIMNSSYGKNSLKPEKYRYVVKKEDQVAKYVLRNSSIIESFEKFGNDLLFKVLNNKYVHYNRAHIGNMILSQSKRIMNEVMGCANKNNIPIFYQDTDSMHMLDRDVNKLGKLFKEEYGREIIGKGLCQFHSDFKPIGPNTRSAHFIALGKKCYIDLIVCDIPGKTSFHTRMKGVNKAALSEYKGRELDLYKDLLLGQEKQFNLLYNGKVSFAMNGSGVYSRNVFTRDLSFPGKIEYFNDEVSYGQELIDEVDKFLRD